MINMTVPQEAYVVEYPWALEAAEKQQDRDSQTATNLQGQTEETNCGQHNHSKGCNQLQKRTVEKVNENARPNGS